AHAALEPEPGVDRRAGPALTAPPTAVHVHDLQRRLAVEERALVRRAAIAFARRVEPALALACLLQFGLDLGQLAPGQGAHVEVIRELGDLAQREARVLGGSDELEALECVVAVTALA